MNVKLFYTDLTVKLFPIKEINLNLPHKIRYGRERKQREREREIEISVK